MKYKPNDVVKSCKKLESGLRFGQEGIAACALGPFQSPIYWNADELASQKISKEMIVKKREYIFELLNDDTSQTPCKTCQMVFEKEYKDVDFTKLGHIDFSATSTCNLRCNYCSYTKNNTFAKSKFNSLDILREFSKDDVLWNSAVDFGGGEPTLLPDFNECLSFFTEMRIRIFLYTNAVKYSDEVYKGLENGTISWVCTSLDAGTPSTYNKTKSSDSFLKVMKNLSKYSEASRSGKGNLSVKYIFTADNCGEDDISGFVFAMAVLKPDKVWLTFDFEPLMNLPGDSENFGDFDYDRLIDAYIKMYLLLKEFGIEAGHFTENHLAEVCNQGKILLEKIYEGISKNIAPISKEFKIESNNELGDIPHLTISPLTICDKGKEKENWSITGMRTLFVPAGPDLEILLNDLEIKQSNILGIIDRNPILHGKKISGYEIFGYEKITSLEADLIIIACHQQHQKDIIEMVKRFSSKETLITVYERGTL